MDYNLLRHISSICNQLPAMTSDKFESAFTQVSGRSPKQRPCWRSSLTRTLVATHRSTMTRCWSGTWRR